MDTCVHISTHTGPGVFMASKQAAVCWGVCQELTRLEGQQVSTGSTEKELTQAKLG